MNALYNLGDLVNKIAFGIAVYSAAGSEEQMQKQMEHRVIRLEMRIMKDWMQQLKSMGIVHRKFRGDLKSWLNLDGESQQSQANNKEVGGKPRVAPPTGNNGAGGSVVGGSSLVGRIGPSAATSGGFGAGKANMMNPCKTMLLNILLRRCCNNSLKNHMVVL